MSETDDAVPSGETLHCLDLFSGLGGFSAAFEDADNWIVTTVDIEERFDPDIEADILDIRPTDLPEADVILASPPCKAFSMAAHGSHLDAEGRPVSEWGATSLALVHHTVGLIKAIDPDWWIIENPMGGMRNELGEPDAHVWWCQYGADRAKPTDFWGRIPDSFVPRRCRRQSSHCDHERASRSTNRGTDASGQTGSERAKIPIKLSEAILESVENPKPDLDLRCPNHGKPRSVTIIDGDARCGICKSNLTERQNTQTQQKRLVSDGGHERPDHGDEQKEQHRLGTINRWDPPEGDWASKYHWTRYRGPDPWPVPGGWVFESPEAGGNWEYFGDAGVGHDDDNSILDELETDDAVDDPYGRLDEQRGERAWLNVETANPEDVSLRNPEDEELKWTLQIGNIEVFSRVEPDRSDLMAAVAEALAAYHDGDLDERVNEITPTTGRVPDDVREQQELEQREEENESLDEFATDGGETIDRFTELPTPDRFFMQIEPAEIEMQPMDHDDVDFHMQLVPGGSFAVELSASYSYAGRECNQHLSLDREGAEELYDALGKALEEDSRR